MTNGERREALARARAKALEYAEAADRFQIIGFDGDGPAIKDASLVRREHLMRLSMMWAGVADALKVGSADGPDATTGSAITNEYGTFTR
jgi:hypothetical protein